MNIISFTKYVEKREEEVKRIAIELGETPYITYLFFISFNIYFALFKNNIRKIDEYSEVDLYAFLKSLPDLKETDIRRIIDQIRLLSKSKCFEKSIYPLLLRNYSKDNGISRDCITQALNLLIDCEA